MFNVEEFAENSGLEVIQTGRARAVIECPKERLEETLVFLKNHLGFVFLTGINYEFVSESPRVYYWFERIDSGFGLGVAVVVDGADLKSLGSISSLYKNALGMESELRRSTGDNSATSPGLNSREAFENEVEKSVEASFVDEKNRSILWLQGPLNPIGDVGAKVTTKNDVVQDCRFLHGMRRSGIEQKLKGKSADALASELLKFDGYDGFVWNVLLYKALEEGNNIEIPDKAKAIRMIFLEFSRIMSHLEFCASVAFQLDGGAFYFKLLEWSAGIEKLQRIYTGNWLNIGALVFGGAHREPPGNWISTCLQELMAFQSELLKAIDKVAGSVLWRQTAEAGRVEAKTLISWGIAGPALRASGINFDLRKRKSFYLYDEVDFDVPIGLNGSLFDRLLVRLEEISQSVGIIVQILDNLPTGDLVAREAAHFSHFSAEDANQESDYRSSIENAPSIEDKFYQDTLESSYGLASIFIRTESSKAVEVYLGGNNHGRISCLEEMAKGASYESLPLLLKSLHINLRTHEK